MRSPSATSRLRSTCGRRRSTGDSTLATNSSPPLSTATSNAAPRGCLLTTTSQQSSYGIPVIRDAVDRGLALVETGLHAALDRAAEQGYEFTSATDDLAKALLHSAQGVLVLARCGHKELESSVTTMLDALLKPASRTDISSKLHDDP